MLMSLSMFRILVREGCAWASGRPEARGDLIRGIEPHLTRLHAARLQRDREGIVASGRQIRILVGRLADLHPDPANGAMQMAMEGVRTLDRQVMTLLESSGAALRGNLRETGLLTGALQMSLALEKAAWDSGLFFRVGYSQDETLLRLSPGAADGLGSGFCMGLVMNWLRHRREGSDFWEWMGSEHAIRFIRYFMAQERIRQAPLGGRGTYRVIAPSMMRLVGFREAGGPEGTWRVGGETGGAFIRKGAYSQEASYCVITLFFADRDLVHLVGIHKVSEGHGTFFDPNVGELDFHSRSALQEWCDSLIHERYSASDIAYVYLFDPV